MNAKTLTPQRATDTLLERFGSTTDEHRLKWRPWLQNPEATEHAVPFSLRRTDIDLFEHVTNTAYWHAIHELTPLAPEVVKPPYRAVIEYRRPIKYGEDVTIRWVRRGSGATADMAVALTVDDEVRAAALLRKL